MGPPRSKGELGRWGGGMWGSVATATSGDRQWIGLLSEFM